ncbi:MAG: hypothetical protein NTW95_12805 [Candidatus Aminicenantes bacterium]|nr:hypothetical protein [Candidatus Aminicenantes bacterium]
MALNFKEALATLYRGLPALLIRAGILAAGGFATIIVFGMLLFAYRVAGGPSAAVVIIAISAVLGWAASGLAAQRFFLFRYRAAMLLLFSGRALPVSGLATALKESRSLFGSYAQWQALNLKLRRAMSFSRGLNGQIAKKPSAGGARRFLDFPADTIIGQAVLVLAFSRDGPDITLSLREGVALVSALGAKSRRLSRSWLWFSAAGLMFIFLCLALPNWFIFSSAGAPVWIGFVLAAIISVLLHQAFVVPFVLAGVSGSLLVETQGKTPDERVCEKLVPFFTP